MSDQYPRPGQPGEQPPTQIAGGGVPPQQGYPQQPGYPAQPGYPPQGYPQQPGQPPYGAPGGGYPGGGYPGGPGGPSYPAPPTGGGGKKTALIVGIVVAVLVLIGGAVGGAVLLLGGDDDGGGTATKRVTKTVTQSVPTDSPTDAPTDVTTDAGSEPADDPTITAQAYLDSLVIGDCLAVEGLSTPEWFASEYGNQAGCKRQAGMAEMSGATYDFADPVSTGSGYTITATITGPDGSTFNGNWEVVADNGTWLVDYFTLA